MLKELSYLKNTFTEFFQRNGLLFFGIMPLMLLTARVAGVINFLWTLIFIPFFWLKNKRTTAILMANFIFILGDNRNDWLENIKPVRNLAMSLMFVLTLWDMFCGKYKFNKQFLYWIPFLLWATYGVTLSPIVVDCGLRTLSYAFMIFITTHAIQYEYKHTEGRLVTDWITFMNVAYCIGFTLLIIKPDWVILGIEFLDEADDARYQSVYGNPNGAGVASTVYFPLLIIERFFLKKFRKSYSNFSFLLLLMTVLMCGSRSGLFSIILFAIFFYIENRSLFTRTLMKYVIIPAGGAFIYLFGLQLILAIPFLAERLRLKANISFEEATSGRGQVWRFLFTMGRFSKMSEWIWVGKGLYFDTYFFNSLLEKYKGLPRQFGAAFSGIVSMVMNHGLIGTFLFLSTHITVYRTIKLKGIALPLFILMLFSSIFEAWVTSSLNAFSLIYYAGIAIAQVGMPTKPISAHVPAISPTPSTTSTE